MRTHFHHELADLEKAVVELAATVQRNVVDAVDSLRRGDDKLAVAVMRRDRDIDLQEVRNEEACLKIIALHQPVADDLRYLVVMLKVNHELERISDLAVDIAEVVHGLDRQAAEPWEKPVAEMAMTAVERLRQAVAALLARDAQAARDIWLADSEINTRSRQLAAAIQDALPATGPGRKTHFNLLTATMQVERLADHVKNIAKDVIYLVVGEIARHRAKEFRPADAAAKLRVLFVCNHNSARSQMAEAWLNHLHGDRFEARSAGLQPGTLNPFAVAAMREVGIDIASHPTRDVFDVVASGEPFDYVITVCDEANAERCPPAVGARQELHWSFADPSTASGDDQAKLEFVRQVRDGIHRRLEEWLAKLEPAAQA